MNSDPFFSIVTISFNQGKYLRQCIDSVALQKFQSYEHIFVDPGSSDGSRELILKYSKHTHCIFESDNGPADGLNRGFASARGTYALFINADDYLLPGALEIAYYILKSRSWPDILFMGGKKVYESVKPSKRIFPGSKNGLLHALGLSTFFQQGTVLKLSVFRASTGFNINNRTCWDGELFLSILFSSVRVERNPCEIAAFRIHNDSISGSGRIYDRYLEDQSNSVRKLYSYKVWLLSRALRHLPKWLRRMMKIFFDPILAKWQLQEFLSFVH